MVCAQRGYKFVAGSAVRMPTITISITITVTIIVNYIIINSITIISYESHHITAVETRSLTCFKQETQTINKQTTISKQYLYDNENNDCPHVSILRQEARRRSNYRSIYDPPGHATFTCIHSLLDYVNGGFYFVCVMKCHSELFCFTKRYGFGCNLCSPPNDKFHPNIQIRIIVVRSLSDGQCKSRRAREHGRLPRALG